MLHCPKNLISRAQFDKLNFRAWLYKLNSIFSPLFSHFALAQTPPWLSPFRTQAPLQTCACAQGSLLRLLLSLIHSLTCSPLFRYSPRLLIFAQFADRLATSSLLLLSISSPSPTCLMMPSPPAFGKMRPSHDANPSFGLFIIVSSTPMPASPRVGPTMMALAPSVAWPRIFLPSSYTDLEPAAFGTPWAFLPLIFCRLRPFGAPLYRDLHVPRWRSSWRSLLPFFGICGNVAMPGSSLILKNLMRRFFAAVLLIFDFGKAGLALLPINFV